MAENNKSMANAKTDEEKEKIVSLISWFVSFVSSFLSYYGWENCESYHTYILHDVAEN